MFKLRNIDDMLLFVHFPVEIWGTVSDWVMIVVTIVTALLLWQTLKSQIHIQRLQTDLFRIERERFRSEIQPAFNIQLEGSKLDINNDEIIFDLGRLNFVLNQNPAFEVNINILDENESEENRWALSDYSLNRKKFLPNTVVSVSGEYNGLKHKTRYYFYLNIEITFKDLDENCYQQFADVVISNYGDDKPKVKISPPERIV